MTKFNFVEHNEPDTVTYEGAAAYSRSTVSAWINMLFSSLMEDRFYESGTSQFDRFIKLTDKMAEKYGYKFIGKAAIFVRNEFGMRSVSHILAAWLNDKKFESKRNFYSAFYHRPDDVGEVFSLIDAFNGKRSHAIVRGTADYLSTLNDYSLMKYRMLGHKYNMYDLINISHANSENINAFKNDKLESADTWEVKISTAKSKEEKDAEWHRLVEKGKLGYMALIRNLNNILNSNISNSWIVEYLCPQLENENKIRKSLIFPYRIYTAFKNLNVPNVHVVASLEKAFLIATNNVPKFDGYNAVVLDVSGSMSDRVSYHSNVTLKDIGACFAATLLLSGSNIDFIKFGTTAMKKTINPLGGPFYVIEEMCKNDGCGYGTYLSTAIEKMDGKYDRIFLISDMQVLDERWFFGDRPVKTYSRKFGNIPTYSFDLGNYHSQIESKNNPNFHFLTSLNDVIFKFISFMESNNNIVDIIDNTVDF